MPGWIGPWGIVIIVAVIVLFYGPKRLPEVGRSLGRGIRELKGSFESEKAELEQAVGREPSAKKAESA